MSAQRLDWSEVAGLLKDWPTEIVDLAVELRKFVLEAAPELSETIAFHSLCYFKAGQPYGVIGGNVCLIGPGKDCLNLAFLHGAALPDPDSLLQGAAKAKRFIELRTSRDICRRSFQDLIRAAIAHQPSA